MPLELGPRQRKSADLITKAMLDLLEVYDYESITISAICNKSTVSRNTFYRIFPGKIDVVDYVLARRVREITARNVGYGLVTRPATMRDVERPIVVAMMAWKEEGELLSLLHRRGLFHRLFAALERNMDNDYSTALIADEGGNSFGAYYFAVISAQIYGLLERWIEGGLRETPEELARMYARILAYELPEPTSQNT